MRKLGKFIVAILVLGGVAVANTTYQLTNPTHDLVLGAGLTVNGTAGTTSATITGQGASIDISIPDSTSTITANTTILQINGTQHVTVGTPLVIGADIHSDITHEDVNVLNVALNLNASGGTTTNDALRVETGKVDLNTTSGTTEVHGNATFDGSVTLDSGLKIQSSGGLELNTTNAHIRTTGSNVTFSTGVGTTCTCASTKCTDIAGTIVMDGVSTTCTMTFVGSYTGADDAGCVVSPVSTAAFPVFHTTATTLVWDTTLASTKYKYNCYETH